MIFAITVRRKGIGRMIAPNRQMQQQKASDIVVVAEDGTYSEEDITLVADGHTHYNDVWVLDSVASYHIYPRRE